MVAISYVTGLWSEFKQVLGVFFAPTVLGDFAGTLRQDSFCNFSGLGGFKYIEKNHYIKSVQAYGVWKHGFFKHVTSPIVKTKIFYLWTSWGYILEILLFP